MNFALSVKMNMIKHDDLFGMNDYELFSTHCAPCIQSRFMSTQVVAGRQLCLYLSSKCTIAVARWNMLGAVLNNRGFHEQAIEVWRHALQSLGFDFIMLM